MDYPDTTVHPRGIELGDAHRGSAASKKHNQRRWPIIEADRQQYRTQLHPAKTVVGRRLSMTNRGSEQAERRAAGEEMLRDRPTPMLSAARRRG